MKYYATVEDKEYVIEVSQDEITVNGQKYAIDFQDLPETGMVSLLINHRSLEAAVEERDDVSEVLIKGELYAVRVQDERAYRLAKARGTLTAVTGEATITSPMPGIIVATPVAEGDIVQAGDTAVILESMKMENELKSPRDGVVKRLMVSPGVGVEKGQALVVIGDATEGDEFESE